MGKLQKLVFVYATIFSWCVHAQVTTGRILGTIRDNTGASVPGALVTIAGTSKGTSQQSQTDDSGSFNAPFLIPSTYSVSVERPGSKRNFGPMSSCRWTTGSDWTSPYR
jgi:hypothetical protein